MENQPAPWGRRVEERRPWGHYILYHENGPVAAIKTLIIQPGKRLSDQRHKERDELWVLQCGFIKVTLESPEGVKQELRLVQGQELSIPRGTWHRIECLAESPEAARLTEIAFGHYDEEDIERRADDFGRAR